MKLIPLGKNSLALLFVSIIAFGFFTAGMFEVLDYFIIKALLFILLAGLLIVAFRYALKNEAEKKRPEDKLQDDSY